MSNRWQTLISSATEHDRLVCELYVDDVFVLLVSNDSDQFIVELSPTAETKLSYGEFIEALQSACDRLTAGVT
ncbi:hypothetical protein G6N74_04845 [Mesorhizobium sp. CGMCC 1.15528]|uniref:Uncharacterized protein n=1 Tax=Mesorhizobium zhangyense TaxID=1776730 RepID=A0A7C9V5F9_9HYPH|nr:hypothetical protein [Mesorhizobium zhangyense]NGN40383.1 hypothetical protein [Mesorhizobium zhangyense]